MKKKIVISVVVLITLVLLIGITAFIFIKSGGFEKDDRNRRYNIPKNLTECGDKKDFFSTSPVSFKDFTNLVPLGNFNPPGHTFPTDHMYFFIVKDNVDDPESIPNKVSVYSPGDMTITMIASQEKYDSGKLTNTDYNMDFSPCQDLSGYFIHMSGLSDKLKKEFDSQEKSCDKYSTGGSNYKNCKAEVEIKVGAGEKIGTAGGMKGQSALDLGLLDFRIEPLKYANQKRWADKSLYTVCPVDYFSSPEKEKLYSRVGDGNQKRTIKPICGQINQDIAGSAQGVWFKKGTPVDSKSTYPEDPHLALVHDNIDYSQPVFSVGNSVGTSGLDSGRYFYIPKKSGLINRDFSDIAPGKVYCFEELRQQFNPEGLGFTILLELPTENTLKIEKQEEPTCGSSQFTSDFSEFER